MNDTAPAYIHGSSLRLDPCARMHKAFGAKGYRVNSSENSGVAEGQGGREPDGRLWAGLRNWREDGVAFIGRGHRGVCRTASRVLNQSSERLGKPLCIRSSVGHYYRRIEFSGSERISQCWLSSLTTSWQSGRIASSRLRRRVRLHLRYEIPTPVTVGPDSKVDDLIRRHPWS